MGRRQTHRPFRHGASGSAGRRKWSSMSPGSVRPARSSGATVTDPPSVLATRGISNETTDVDKER
jgi:hypothetical protein